MIRPTKTTDVSCREPEVSLRQHSSSAEWKSLCGSLPPCFARQLREHLNEREHQTLAAFVQTDLHLKHKLQQSCV